MTASADDVIFELTRIGSSLKCSAVHVASGVEVSVIGPVNAPTELKRVALAKLRRALTLKP